jgi:hypothetical protein
LRTILVMFEVSNHQMDGHPFFTEADGHSYGESGSHGYMKIYGHYGYDWYKDDDPLLIGYNIYISISDNIDISYHDYIMIYP